MKKITKEQLIEFGMIETTDEEKILFPMKKVISIPKEENEELGEMALCITMMYNVPELCLSLPDGSCLFLAIKTINQLKIFEKSIARWEPNY